MDGCRLLFLCRIIYVMCMFPKFYVYWCVWCTGLLAGVFTYSTRARTHTCTNCWICLRRHTSRTHLVQVQHIHKYTLQNDWHWHWQPQKQLTLTTRKVYMAQPSTRKPNAADGRGPIHCLHQLIERLLLLHSSSRDWLRSVQKRSSIKTIRYLCSTQDSAA